MTTVSAFSSHSVMTLPKLGGTAPIRVAAVARTLQKLECMCRSLRSVHVYSGKFHPETGQEGELRFQHSECPKYCVKARGGDGTRFTGGYLHSDQRFSPLLDAMPALVCARVREATKDIRALPIERIDRCSGRMTPAVQRRYLRRNFRINSLSLSSKRG
jgi:hypothetical protein